ncbi:hypothetical protein Salat_1371300 [Sesamum alatum]|uniref:Coiled-coil domain-containing protein 86 n=1 Tax=Sesamum alatum TaxID=300844 RepID=A0AAE1YAG2_9LAMI|nr:hypothetical protein Salat_1371300 [Sesamum alatum]
MACTIDFRRLDEGFGGKTFKRKRSEQEADKLHLLSPSSEAPHHDSMEVDTGDRPPAKRLAVQSSDDPNKPSFGKPTYDGVIAGKVSGRKWKEVRTHRASAVHVSKKRTTVEQRMKEKEIKKAYRERMNELKEEIRQNKQEKRKRREEREKKKQENTLRSGTKLQKITNPNTLKKIAKSKQRKLLKVVPDDVVNRNSDSNKKKSNKKEKKEKPQPMGRWQRTEARRQKREMAEQKREARQQEARRWGEDEAAAREEKTQLRGEMT